MPRDLWLPKGYKLSDGSEIKSTLFSGRDWQVFRIRNGDNILVARLELAQQWYMEGFLTESLFGNITFGTALYKTLRTNGDYALMPVENGLSPSTKTDAISFSLSLRESRKVSKDASFHDAIYVSGAKDNEWRSAELFWNWSEGCAN